MHEVGDVNDGGSISMLNGDIRANKAFNFDRWKLTLFGEVLNILDDENVRYTSEADSLNTRLSVDRDSMFPLLPIAGIRIEF